MDLWVKEKDLLIERQLKSASDDFIDQLVACRKEKKLTQQDIADRSGMRRENISRIENKKNIPTLDVLFKYAYCMDMEIDLSLIKK